MCKNIQILIAQLPILYHDWKLRFPAFFLPARAREANKRQLLLSGVKISKYTPRHQKEFEKLWV